MYLLITALPIYLPNYFASHPKGP